MIYVWRSHLEIINTLNLIINNGLSKIDCQLIALKGHH